MGTWGPGNLENDGALDELGDRVSEFITEMLERARSPTSREGDEYDYTILFVDFEILFALESRGLLQYGNLPAPAEVEDLKQDYIRDWDANIDALEPTEEHKKKRRQCIMRTFNRFKQICERHLKARQQ